MSISVESFFITQFFNITQFFTVFFITQFFNITQFFTGHEFLGYLFTNFNFEYLLSHEGLLTGRLTASSCNQTQIFKWLQMKKNVRAI